MAVKLLVVEDCITVYETICGYLDHLYELEHAMSGREALEKLKFGPSLVLLDLNLPDGHGLKLIEKIKSMNVPVIIITGEKSKETVVKALQNGISDYLTKPIDADRLRKSIKKALKA